MVPQTVSKLVIRPVDTTDAEEMGAYQRVYAAAERAELPDAAVYSARDSQVLLTREARGAFWRGYAAFEGDQMVGEGLITGGTTDSLQTARMWAWVPPEHRSRGVGSAIVEFLVEQCRALGRGILHSTASYPFARRDDHPYRRFAERHGFTLANTEVERRLALPVSEDRLAGLERAAASHHQGYRLRTVLGAIPPEIAPGYVDVQNRLRVDAPSGDLIVEEGRRTADVVADQDRELEAQGRTRVTTVASDAEGTVVAFSCAIVTLPGEPHVDQWGTVVRPADRGHRLGLAVKVALVRAIQESFPDKRFITTTNAETNDHMVAINEALGFETYALSADFQRILPGFGPYR